MGYGLDMGGISKGPYVRSLVTWVVAVGSPALESGALWEVPRSLGEGLQKECGIPLILVFLLSA